MRPGYVITAVEGEAVSTEAQFRRVVDKLKRQKSRSKTKGIEVEITFTRSSSSASASTATKEAKKAPIKESNAPTKTS